MNYIYDDGGRKTTGYRGTTRDCVTRAIAIATEKPYQEVYDHVNDLAKDERIGRQKKSNARLGVRKKTSKSYLLQLGWKWTPTMFIGQGCKVHLADGELPMGRIIAKVSRHMVAVIDGVIHDTYDCSRGETRCVYGYFSKR